MALEITVIPLKAYKPLVLAQIYFALSHSYPPFPVRKATTMTPHPRPILIDKREPSLSGTSSALPFTSCGNMGTAHVHFPPTPWLTSMRYTHSPNTYDRAPIAVSPNVCQLPERDARKLRSPPVHAELERGRSPNRHRGRHAVQPNDVKGSYFHPRAYEACQPEPLDVPPSTFDFPSPPELVADLSPSEESDDSVDTPPDPERPATIATPVSLHLSDKSSSTLSSSPERARGRLNSDASSMVPPLPPMAKTVHGRRTKPILVRRSRQVDMFALVTDEGCLGGF